jgi:formamidopyrimidine-DNA glycosylase
MPELPEVERGRRIAEATAAGRTIVRARCADDRIVFDDVAPRTVERALRGRLVVAAHRRGKQLWLELDAAPHPLFHFGMSGAFSAPGRAPLQLASGPRVDGEPNWPPRFTKIHLLLDDGGELVMTDARRFGRIRLRRAPLQEPPLSELGFDPLIDLPTADQFRLALAARRGTIKGVLLDQSFAAGVGNWIADEVLYQAGIDPRRRARNLDAAAVGRLHRAIRRVIRLAVEADADDRRYPRHWLFHHRWGRQVGARTARGEAIEHVTLGGRTAAWVPSVQR